MKQKFQVFSLLVLALFQFSNTGNAQEFFKQHPQINPYQYTVVKEQSFQKAAVTSAHPLASMVGAAIMKDGGNAFDAAIAVQFTLAVVFPSAGNIGGGGFLLSRNKEGVLMGIDFREAAPSKAHRDMYLDENGNPIDGMSRLGASASGIPGSVAGMFSTLPFAKMTMKQLLQPAYELAAGGFVITESEARSLNAERKNFINHSAQASAFTRKENWKAGDTLYQPELAATILRIQQKGKAGFYEGETAELIVKEMKNSKGVISLEDLKNYNPKFRKPIEFDYRGHHIISFAPPSSGGILIAQMLQMIAPYPVSVMGANTFESVSLMVEAQRRAYADRAEHMGDPDYWKVPTTTLTSNAYAQERMKDYQAGVAGNSKMIQAGTTKESEQTTHFSVVDEAGNMVAVTTTLNGSYGNKTIVGGAGFLLNNEMGDFNVSLSVSYVDDERRKDTDDDPFVSIMNQERRLRSRSYLSLSWNKDDWSTGISTSRIGSMGYFSSFAPNPTGRNKIEPYFDVGAFLRYDIDVGHIVQVSVSNLFDDAPKYNTDLGFPWFSEYYYSPVGREVFITYKYTF